MIKFSCEKVFLQNAIAVTSRAVAQKSSIPALEGLLIHADQQLTISGYNMQTGIRTNVFANVVEGGDIVLNARLFGDIIRRMPDDMITFTADEKMMVHVSCGDADFDILGLSAADYPDLPEVEDEYAVSMQQKVLRSMIEEVAFAVSTNESRPVHTGALFEIADMSLSMVAVDGFRLAFRREKLEKLEGGAFSFVCPGSALSEVKSICGDTEDLVTVTLGKRHILFEIGDTQLICRRLEGEFLDYKNAIPRKNPIQIVAETKALIESIDRVSVVISDKLKSPVRCLFDHDKVMLSAKTGNGEAKDVCRVSGDGDKLVPFDKNAAALARKLPVAPDFRLLAGAGHFVFMAPCNDEQIVITPALCTDADGVDREVIHRHLISEAGRFFAHALGKATRAGMQTADQ